MLNQPLGGLHVIEGLPLLADGADGMASVAAYTYQQHSVVFIGTRSGNLKKVRVDGFQDAHLYETVPVVDGSPILRDLLFSPDHQHIYLLSEKQVGPWRAVAGGGGEVEGVLTWLSTGEAAPGGDV